MLHPIVNVNLGHTTNKQLFEQQRVSNLRAGRRRKETTYLEFSLIENVDQFLRYQFVETAQERLELILDTPLNPPFDEQLHVLGLVVVRDRNVSSSGFQVDSDRLSESIIFGRESVLDDIFNIVFAV